MKAGGIVDRETAFEDLKHNPQLWRRLNDLARVPDNNRELFATLIVEAIVYTWHPPEKRRAGTAVLEQYIKLLEQLERLPIPEPLRDFIDSERQLAEYLSALRTMLNVALFVKEVEDHRTRRPRGRQRRKLEGSSCPPWELFAAAIYQATRRAGGRLSVNKNASDLGASGRLSPGSFKDVLELLRPFLPPNFLKGVSMGALDKIKRVVDRKSPRAA
jgi:hypothetical protein